MATKKTMDIWFCDKCGKGYTSEYAANICCKQYHCSVCGVETPRYITKCDLCRDKELFEKAQKMTWEEYLEKSSGNMLYWNDEFYADLGDLLDASESGGFDVPDYVFGTYRDYLRLDAERHIAELIDEFDCDGVYFDNAGVKEFVEFANAWNKKYEEYCFRPDTSIVVLVQEVCRKRDHDD